MKTSSGTSAGRKTWSVTHELRDWDLIIGLQSTSLPPPPHHHVTESLRAAVSLRGKKMPSGLLATLPGRRAILALPTESKDALRQGADKTPCRVQTTGFLSTHLPRKSPVTVPAKHAKKFLRQMTVKFAGEWSPVCLPHRAGKETARSDAANRLEGESHWVSFSPLEAFWWLTLRTGLAASSGSCDGSPGEKASPFKASAQGEVITAFPNQGQLVSSDMKEKLLPLAREAQIDLWVWHVHFIEVQASVVHSKLGSILSGSMQCAHEKLCHMVTLWIQLMLFSNPYNYCVWFLSRISSKAKNIRDSVRAVMRALISDRDLNWGLKNLILSFIFCKGSSALSRFLSHHNAHTYRDCLTVKCSSHLGSQGMCFNWHFIRINHRW